MQNIKTDRIPALDFSKGALVLIMVLYHWLNYFYQSDGDIYRYLRFLTPSFIFITGFLISNVSIAKYGIGDARLSRKLLQRGLKLLGVFAALNIVRACLLSGPTRSQILIAHSSLRGLVQIYIVGIGGAGGPLKAVAFPILIPIGYLLLLSALLLVIARVYKNIFYVVFLAAMVGVFALEWFGKQSANLELIAIGLLGLILGYAPIEKINAVVRHPFWLAVAYACYVAAITVWNVIYPLQIVGVCLSVAIIYLLGDGRGEPGRVRRCIILLGRYSLLGYIAQIAILQLLHGGLRHVELGWIALLASFVAAFALTILAVEATEWARGKVPVVDRLYKAVFA